MSRWELRPPLFVILVLRFAGTVLITSPFIAHVDPFARFIVQGIAMPGTPLLISTRERASNQAVGEQTKKTNAPARIRRNPKEFYNSSSCLVPL